MTSASLFIRQILCAMLVAAVPEEVEPKGPLTAHPSNRRYFADGTGKAVYLTGSHTWSSFQDMGGTDPPPVFDYSGYLDFLKKYNHNFFRLWSGNENFWSTGGWYTVPAPYKRTGPGSARDGKPKFDLTRFNSAYFDRLRSRVIAARERGIYVSVMFFKGDSVRNDGNNRNWAGHYFHRDNNINGIDGDRNGDGAGLEVHRGEITEIVQIQEAFVRKVLDTLNDLDNVLYEICNECDNRSTAWQYRWIQFVRLHQRRQPRQHPIGMTVQTEGSDATLFSSPADWISPGDQNYKYDPPAATGAKIILTDTDHYFGVGGDQSWVWKSFTRGLNPIFMDPIDDPKWELTRRSTGYTLLYANRVNLASLRPRGDLCSSTYCLANPGIEYLIYVPTKAKSRRMGRLKRLFGQQGDAEGFVSADLSPASGTFNVEWLNPRTGEIRTGGPIRGGARRLLRSPFAGDSVLYIKSTKASGL